MRPRRRRAAAAPHLATAVPRRAPHARAPHARAVPSPAWRRAKGRGGLLLRESAQCPDADEAKFQDVTRHKFFNTSTPRQPRPRR